MNYKRLVLSLVLMALPAKVFSAILYIHNETKDTTVKVLFTKVYGTKGVPQGMTVGPEKTEVYSEWATPFTYFSFKPIIEPNNPKAQNPQFRIFGIGGEKDEYTQDGWKADYSEPINTGDRGIWHLYIKH